MMIFGLSFLKHPQKSTTGISDIVAAEQCSRNSNAVYASVFQRRQVACGNPSDGVNRNPDTTLSQSVHDSFITLQSQHWGEVFLGLRVAERPHAEVVGAVGDGFQRVGRSY